MTFLFRDTFASAHGVVEVGFTDRRLDLADHAPAGVREAGLGTLAETTGCAPYLMQQMHGSDVIVVEDRPGSAPAPPVDAVLTARPGLALVARAADCVPLLLVGRTGLVGAVHAGRRGVQLAVATAAVGRMRELGAEAITAWIGPHICGWCYEVPEAMRAEVATAVPATHATTSWGTPALDLGAGIRSQLEDAGCAVVEVGLCTREDQRLHSLRRDGPAAGRGAGVIWRPRAEETKGD